MNKDGQMDKLEFSIAMKLIRNCLAGIPLPPTLPESLKQIAPAPMVPSMAPQMSLPRPAIPQMMPSMQRAPLPTPAPMMAPMPGSVMPPTIPVLPMRPSQATSLGTRELNDWTVPQHFKLRFSQQFNQFDRNRIGVLTGNQARGILGESQLPTTILAEIWNLSDVNKDGCLSIDEFVIAMYFVEMAKVGFIL